LEETIDIGGDFPGFIPGSSPPTEKQSNRKETSEKKATGEDGDNMRYVRTLLLVILILSIAQAGLAKEYTVSSFSGGLRYENVKIYLESVNANAYVLQKTATIRVEDDEGSETKEITVRNSETIKGVTLYVYTVETKYDNIKGRGGTTRIEVVKEGETVNSVCGDGRITGNEYCDGDNIDCVQILSNARSGRVACKNDCSDYDISNCVYCGNNEINLGEVCDGTNFAGESCEMQGYDSGTPTCLNCMQIDYSTCTNAEDAKPTVEITSPEDGSGISGSVTVTATASHTKKIGKIQLLLSSPEDKLELLPVSCSDSTKCISGDTDCTYGQTCQFRFDTNKYSSSPIKLTAVVKGDGGVAVGGIEVTDSVTVSIKKRQDYVWIDYSDDKIVKRISVPDTDFDSATLYMFARTKPNRCDRRDTFAIVVNNIPNQKIQFKPCNVLGTDFTWINAAVDSDWLRKGEVNTFDIFKVSGNWEYSQLIIGVDTSREDDDYMRTYGGGGVNHGDLMMYLDLTTGSTKETSPDIGYEKQEEEQTKPAFEKPEETEEEETVKEGCVDCLDEVSIQLKRTSPGIAGKEAAEIIFDVVNTDMTHKLEGFLLCRSPDDVTTSSSLGTGEGSGAQYVSPLFTLGEGPSQTAISLVLDSDWPGKKTISCSIKYIQFTDDRDAANPTKEYLLKDYTYSATPQNTDYSVYQVEKELEFRDDSPILELTPRTSFFRRFLCGLFGICMGGA